MDISKALENLKINKYNFNSTELKKAYLKQALLCHPDKIGNTPNNTHKFQDLKESYDFLMLYTDSTHENTTKENINIIDLNTDLFKMFINNVLGDKYINIFIDILLGITDLSLLLCDNNISIETINKIKHFVNKYKESDTMSNNSTNNVNGTIPQIYNYVLNPTIDDLLDDNIYKLNINNSIFLVPLWHHECIYEHTDGKDITVNCIPILPKNIYIDDKNHIYTSISISLNNSLLNEIYYINIGKKKYTIPINKLYIQSKPQQICLSNCGILEMTDLDLYTNNNNILIRSNIYVTITLI
jgi:hypothetical protein